MSESSGVGGSTAADTTASAGGASSAELITRLTQQSTELIRSELRLAQAEMTAKAKVAGVGAGLFGGAGIMALYGVGTLIATVILALSLIVPGWLAALIVTGVLFVIAGVVALVGKKQVAQATPAVPQQAIVGVKRDIDTVKKGTSA
jgi:hypothetical protein